MSEAGLSATIHAGAAEIPAAVWNRLAPGTDGRPDNPFLDHAFFRALEQSGSATARTGWQPRHILIRGADDEPLALMPLYLKSHSQGEYVFDHAWADAYMRAGGDYYPKLQCSVPFTPATAPKLLAAGADPRLRTALLHTAEQLCGRLGASSVHATFLPEPEADAAAAAGWLIRHDTQFHWRNEGYDDFDGFLATLASRKRKLIRRERRDALAHGLDVRWITGADLAEHHWDAFFEFYMDTGGRKWGRPYLNRAFFSMLGESMPDRVLLMLVHDGPEPIAGALNLIGRDAVYGRYWGCTVDVPFLHFEVCYYQAIDYAIENRLRVVEAGAQGEHKLARGYAPVTTRSAHWLAHPGLRQAVADYLDRERVSVAREQRVLDAYTPFRKGPILTND